MRPHHIDRQTRLTQKPDPSRLPTTDLYERTSLYRLFIFSKLSSTVVVYKRVNYIER